MSSRALPVESRNRVDDRGRGYADPRHLRLKTFSHFLQVTKELRPYALKPPAPGDMGTISERVDAEVGERSSSLAKAHVCAEVDRAVPKPAPKSPSGPVWSALGRVGRPTKFNRETRSTLLEGIEAGLPFSTACVTAGLSYETFRRWMVKGRTAKRGQFRSFRVEVRRAEARAKIQLLASWVSATRHDWRAAKAYLESRWPREFAPPCRCRRATHRTACAHVRCRDAEVQQIEVIPVLPRPRELT